MSHGFMYFMLLLWVIAARQCPTQQKAVTAEAHLYGMWWHAYEEDTLWQVYRKEGYPFPLTRRGRTGLELKPDGEGAIWETGPADRPEATAVTWELQKGYILLFRPLQNPKPAFRVKVKEAAADRLMLEW